MLSKKTSEHLNIACTKSDEAYQEGGLIYLYKFGHRRAHSFIDRKSLSSISGGRLLGEKETEQLAWFFSSATEHPYPEKASELATMFTKELLINLYHDFEGMHGFISQFEEDSTSKELTITFIKDNDFHSLELFWSID